MPTNPQDKSPPSATQAKSQSASEIEELLRDERGLSLLFYLLSSAGAYSSADNPFLHNASLEVLKRLQSRRTGYLHSWANVHFEELPPGLHKAFRLIFKNPDSVTLQDLLDASIFKYLESADSDNPLLELEIKRCIELSPYRWRTARGIAKDLGADQVAVETILANNKLFVRSDIPAQSGAPLYTTRKIYRTKTSPLRRLGDFLTGKVTI